MQQLLNNENILCNQKATYYVKKVISNLWKYYYMLQILFYVRRMEMK